MEKDFKQKYQNLIEPTNDIDIAMFGSGFWIRYSENIPFDDRIIYNPIKDKLKKQWNEEVWLDSIGADDPDEPEDKLYTLGGVQYPLYQIEKAIKFNRPSWVFFYFAGHVIG